MPHQREETDESQSQATSNVAWFLTGAVIGATAMILYAPKSGKDTRQYIADRTQQGRVAVESTTEDLVGAGKEMFERGRKLVEDAADLFDRGRKLVKG